jgi:hypothetical protein
MAKKILIKKKMAILPIGMGTPMGRVWVYTFVFVGSD